MNFYLFAKFVERLKGYISCNVRRRMKQTAERRGRRKTGPDSAQKQKVGVSVESPGGPIEEGSKRHNRTTMRNHTKPKSSTLNNLSTPNSSHLCFSTILTILFSIKTHDRLDMSLLLYANALTKFNATCYGKNSRE